MPVESKAAKFAERGSATSSFKVNVSPLKARSAVFLTWNVYTVFPAFTDSPVHTHAFNVLAAGTWLSHWAKLTLQSWKIEITELEITILKALEEKKSYTECPFLLTWI